MKRILAVLFTFSIGISASYLLGNRQVAITENHTPVQETATVSTPLYSYTSDKKIKVLKPFFDSFEKETYNDANEYQGYNGWFRADDFKGMPEVWTIWLSRDYENSENEKLVWSAEILTQYPEYSSNDDDFHSVWMKAEGSHLSFRTNKIRGIEYRFDGAFFKDGKDFEQDEKVLRGTMQKIIRGKQVAKFTADFGYVKPRIS